MRTPLPMPRYTGASLLVLLSACGGGGGGGAGGGGSSAAVDESEPNDSPATAARLALGQFGHGVVADGADTDFWKVGLASGELVSVEVLGNRFDQAGWSSAPNAAKVTLFDRDGVSVLLEQGDSEFAWNAEQDTDILAFRAPAAGTYYLRVDVDDPLLAGGAYLVAARAASTVAPLQAELEPAGVAGLNDDALTAEAIVPGTLAGFYVDGEVDWYAFSLAEPSFVTFTMRAHRNGVWQGDDSLYDPALELYDSTQAVLAGNDDEFYLDSALHHLLTVPGDYFIAVFECCGFGDSGYELEFTSKALAASNPLAEVEPNDSPASAQTVFFTELVMGDVSAADDDYFAFACDAGDRIQVEVFDAGNHQGALADVAVSIEDGTGALLPSDAGGQLSIRRTILTSPGTYFVHVTATAATAYALRVTQTPAAFESEPNDVPASAGAFDAAGRAAGVIATPGDRDLFAFQATLGLPVVLSCLADDVGPGGFPSLDGFGSALDPILAVKDAGGTLLARSDATLATAVGVVDGLATVTLAFLPPASGTYFAELVDQGGNAGADFHYVLEMR